MNNAHTCLSPLRNFTVFSLLKIAVKGQQVIVRNKYSSAEDIISSYSFQKSQDHGSFVSYTLQADEGWPTRAIQVLNASCHVSQNL